MLHVNKVYLYLATQLTKSSPNVVVIVLKCTVLTHPQPPLNSNIPKFNIMGKSGKKNQ